MPLTAKDLVTEAKRHIVGVNPDAAKAFTGNVSVIEIREPKEQILGALRGRSVFPLNVLEFRTDSRPTLQNPRNANIPDVLSDRWPHGASDRSTHEAEL